MIYEGRNLIKDVTDRPLEKDYKALLNTFKDIKKGIHTIFKKMKSHL